MHTDRRAGPPVGFGGPGRFRRPIGGFCRPRRGISDSGGICHEIPAPAPSHSYPATFAGAANGVLAVLRSDNGRTSRVLVAGATYLPQIGQHRHVVYYLQSGPGQGQPCSSIMRVPYFGGRPTVVSQFYTVSVGAFTLSHDGQTLIYNFFPQTDASPQFPCASTDPSKLAIVDLSSGAAHLISHFPYAFDMALSPNGRDLAFEFPHGGSANSTVQVLANPTSITWFRRGAPVPCPDGARSCAQFSPHYDRAGQLFYVAALPGPNAVERFVLTRVDGREGVVLAAVAVPAKYSLQNSASCAVDWAGGAAIFTVPGGRDGRTYRWSGGTPARLWHTVFSPSW